MVAKSQEDWAEITSSEYRVIMPHVRGNAIDVCCGGRLFPGTVGIDMVPNGEPTQPWGNRSVAHFCCDCSNLFFAPDSLDTVVAIHAIEHFVDTEATLREWLRVLKVGGSLCLIVPDIRYTPAPGSPDHDFTHFREYDPDAFRLVIESVTGLEVVQYDTMNNQWSFDVVVRKVLDAKNIEFVDDVVEEYGDNIVKPLTGSGLVE